MSVRLPGDDDKRLENRPVAADEEPKWLAWARKLAALAQSGLTYTDNPFEIERYEAVRQVAAEIMAEYSGTDLRRIVDLFARQSGYATPKVDVRGVVFRDEAVLLVKERSDGRWTLPGGWADVNESPAEAVVREVFEESGYQTRAIKLLAVLDRAKQAHVPPYPFHIYKLLVRCELLGGEPTTCYEIEDVGFFREDAIPDLSLSRTTPAQIARLFEHLRQPDLPADLD